MYKNQGVYPNLAQFFYNLKADILQFEDFFDKGSHLPLLNEIKQFGRQVVGKDLQDFWLFSKRFNAKIIYFEDNEKVVEINEADFIEPVEVNIFKTGTRVFIVYKVDSNRKQVKGFDINVTGGIYEVFEELGSEVFNTLKLEVNDDKKAVVEKLVKNNQGANYIWKFLL